MAYNSDGYIMIDFTEVDFSKTNQTIDGLFDRCQKVIGTNKFVIVINANNKTPLPSTVCITNGQYVIESVLFTFVISSSDNLHITKKTTTEELIDDNHVTLKTTFSSNKIMALLAGVAKSFTYIGNGQSINKLTFPEKPSIIFIECGVIPIDETTDRYNNISPFVYGAKFTQMFEFVSTASLATSPISRGILITYDDEDDKIINLKGLTPNQACNNNNIEYKVYYI